MSEREIYVEDPLAPGDWPDGGHAVFDDNDWLASFRNREDAEEWAEQKRLEP